MNELVLSIQEFNTLVASLTKLPWEQVNPIIEYLKGIAARQVQAAKATEAVPAE